MNDSTITLVRITDPEHVLRRGVDFFARSNGRLDQVAGLEGIKVSKVGSQCYCRAEDLPELKPKPQQPDPELIPEERATMEIREVKSLRLRYEVDGKSFADKQSAERYVARKKLQDWAEEVGLCKGQEWTRVMILDVMEEHAEKLEDILGDLSLSQL